VSASGLRIGIDLGGTKIEGVALGGGDMETARRRIATPRDDYAATIGAIAAMVAEIERNAGSTGTVGIGIPGSLSPATGLVKNANSTWLNGMPFHKDLERALGRPVRLANDANCFALSEAADGAGAGVEVVFGVILGTGVGGGIVVGGAPWGGRNAIAGEWGHTPLPWPGDDERPGPTCWCGLAGCVETYLSGPGLSREFARDTGVALDAARIAEAADAGETAAEAALARYESRLARALAVVVDVVDPDVIVLGGGLSNVRRLYENVPRLWSRWIFSDRVDTPLLPPRHGDASGVRGAARLWEAGTATI
jgi:fructokinase